MERARRDQRNSWFQSLRTRGAIDATCCPADGVKGDVVRDFILYAASTPRGNRVILFKGLSITGDIDLKGCAGLGSIEFEQCAIVGNLILEGAELRALKLDGTNVRAVRGTRARIRGSVYMRWKFVAHRGVDLSGSWIEGTLTFRGAELGPDHERFCLKLRHATIGGTLYLGPKDKEEEKATGDRLSGQVRLRGSLDFSGLHVKEFVDHEDAYDLIHDDRRLHIVLDGFEYQRLGGLSPLGWNFRVNEWFCLQQNVWTNARKRSWLKFRRPRSSPTRESSAEAPQFIPQPFEQLAKVLKAMGHDYDSKTVMYMKRDAQHYFNLMQGSKDRSMSESRLRKLGRLLAFPIRWLIIVFYGRIAGYGYRMGTLTTVIILLVCGQIIGLRMAAHAGLMAPAQLGAMNSDWWLACRNQKPPSLNGSLLFAELRGALKGGADLDRCLRGAVSLPTSASDAPQRFSDYPSFSPTIFGIESFFPMIDLGQTSHWMVSDRTPKGRVLGRWMALYGIMGWIATSLVIAGLFARFNQRGSD